MSFTTTPFDFLIVLALAVRRLGLRRAFYLTLFVGLPAYSYSLPPISCGCMRPVFRRCTSGARYLAAAKSDLKNLASQQEIYFSEHGAYTHDPQALAFTASYGVTVTILASTEAWAATATHAALAPEGPSCTMYYGDAEALGGFLGDAEPGQVVCGTG